MKKAYIMIGCPGSGKSTLAQKFVAGGCSSVSLDQAREDIYGDMSIQGDPTSVVKFFKQALRYLLNIEANIVIDNTSVKNKDRQSLLSVLKGYKIYYVLLNPPKETCKLRNSSRARVVPEEVIDRMYDTLQQNLDLIRLDDKAGKVTLIEVPD